MSEKIKVGIVGYGNLGKGVELAIQQNSDFELIAIFTRRQPEDLGAHSLIKHIDTISEYTKKIDIMILCGGSATDLPEQTPQIAKLFHTVDSFDNHGKIPEYYEKIHTIAKQSGKISVISTGWDPGLFSMNRLLGEAILPEGNTYTFWGKGVSQGHSDAVRRVDGVKHGVQYTIPNEEAVDRVRSGENPDLTTRMKHVRDCYIVPEAGADLEQIKHDIQTMPNYFADFDTSVTFITEEELERDHSAMPHGGIVLRSGVTGTDRSSNQVIEFGLTLGSNPEFTSSVLVAYARAAARLAKEGQAGAKTVFDIPLGYLSPKSAAQLRKELL